MPRSRPCPRRRAVTRASLAPAFLVAGLTLPIGAALAQPVQFEIAAQPLAPALGLLANQAGLQLVFAPELAQGRQAPAVNGVHEVADALRQLLADSGLQGRVQGRTLVVERIPVPASGSREATLPAVTVSGSALRDGTTEGSGAYKATATNTATRLNLTPRETPQTLSVVTSQQMQDFGMTSVDDALKAISGTFVAEEDNNGAFSFSRGFQLQSQYDGTLNPLGISNNNRNPQIDNAFLDRVEVLQGAAGLLTGAGTPGGTINLVRKRPTESFQAQAEAQLSSWGGRRIVGDVAGPFIESGRIRGRVVAVADNSKSFVDYAYRNRRAVYGVIEADLTSTTTLDASVQYQQDTGRNHLGAPFAADGSEPGIRRSFFFGDAGQRTVKDYMLTTLGLRQQLAGDWQARATFTHGKTNSDIFRYSYVRGELDMTTGDGLTLNRQRGIVQDLGANVVDVYAAGPFQLFGRRHEAALGLNGSSLRHSYRGAGYMAPMPFNVHTFDPGALGDIPDGTPYFGDTRTTQLGAYGVARFSLSDTLKLIAGARISNYRNEDLLAGRTSSKESGVISPYAGLIYDLGSQVSVYASYSDIFNPQTQKRADGAALEPVVGANYEAGIKGELLDKRLNVAAAVFRLEQTRLPRRDPSVFPDPANACGGTCYTAADKVVSQGIDLSASGELAAGWNVAVGYTFVDSQYASGEDEGQRYNPYLPRHSLRVATAYRIPGADWTLGGSLTARNKIHLDDTSWTTGDPYTIRSGGLVLAGLMAKYQINPRADLTMTVSNLFDRTYRAHLENKYYSAWGEPRRISASLRYRF